MENLVSLSIVAVYSAIGVYTVAFLMFTLDLAKRAGGVVERTHVPMAVSVGAGASEQAEPPERPELPRPDAEGVGGATRFQRAAIALTALGWALHLAAVLFRGIAAQRVPWVNLFEFGLVATAMGVGVFLLAQLWKDLRFLGAYITGFTVLSLGIVTVNYYVDVVPLAPALQSVWLVIHVLVASLATALFALGAGLSVVQLLRVRREARAVAGLRFLDTLPGSATLESMAYRINIVGFVLWTFTLIAGAIWAERSWGRYWGWDTKEVWTFIIWTLFAGYIHARATRGWRGDRSAWLAIIGFSAIIFNYTVVNTMFTGLHAYSGLVTNPN